MSCESEIEEDIIESVEEEIYTEDEELEEDIDITNEMADNCESDLKDDVVDGAKVNGLRTADYIAIEMYSNTLAKSVLTEAILINEVYKRDKINVIDGNVDNGEFCKDLSDHDNGNNESSGQTPAKYDSYIIEKFLHSKADPIDVSGEVGFDGKEEYFQNDNEEMYPGLDKDDVYVQRMGRMETEEMSDTNNNKMPVSLLDPFSESLQTIHEDAELVIDNHRDGNDSADEFKNDLNEDGDDDIEKAANDMEKTDNNDDSGIEQQENGDDSFKDIPGIPKDEPPTCTYDQGDQNIPEEPESDEEVDCCEMTNKEKRRMVSAVREGDIDQLERLLEKRNANMAMTWYGENLLMVAIRAGQQEMAEFLIDNGIDWTFEAKLVEVGEKGTVSIHRINCRQMAYDCNMNDCVVLLDQKSNNLFPFIKPKPRDPRLRKPILPFAPPSLDEGIKDTYLVKPEDIDEIIQQEKERILEMKNNTQADDGTGDEKGKKKTDNDNDSVITGKSKNTCSDLNLSNDELSQVFGRDEGYETMSPISPLMPMKFDYHIPDFSKPVSVRGTRASHLIRAHNATKVEYLKMHSSSARKDIETVGSYNFESRRWKLPHSAPQERNHSVQSTPRSEISAVRVGLPFIHGKEKEHVNYSKLRPQTTGTGRERISFSSDPGRNQFLKYRSKSAHSNVSPYSQVAKLLEQSRLFNPLMTSSTTQLPLLKKMNSHANTNNIVTKTRINYIYADRGSAKSRSSEAHVSKTDLLPKRKLKC